MENFRYHFRSLTDFSSPEPRSAFWPYLVAVAITAGLLSIAGAFAIWGSAARGLVNRFGSEFLTTAWALTLFATSLLLISAAVARRLKDAGVPTGYGLVPLPFMLAQQLAAASLFRTVSSDAGSSGAAFIVAGVANVALLGAVVWWIALLRKPSTHSANGTST